MSAQGFKPFVFAPPTTSEGQWWRLDVRGSSLELLAGIRPSYRLRFIVKGQDGPLEYTGPLYPGLVINAQFDALEWVFGDTASAPAAEEVKLLVNQRRIGVAARVHPWETVPTTRTVSTSNGTAVDVLAGAAVTLFDDSTADIYYPSSTNRPFTYQRQRFQDLYLHGYIMSPADDFDVYLFGWANVNNPAASEPFCIDRWDAKALTIAAAVSADTAQWSWQAGANNTAQTLISGAMRWPQGGGKLIVLNPTGGTIGLHYHLCLSSQP